MAVIRTEATRIATLEQYKKAANDFGLSLQEYLFFSMLERLVDIRVTTNNLESKLASIEERLSSLESMKTDLHDLYNKIVWDI